jgi:hypothetical protein
MATEQAKLNVTSLVRKTLRHQPVLCVRSTRTGDNVADALEEAWQARMRQGLGSAGPPYTFFFKGGWEAGVPVDREGAPEGRVVPAVLPGGDVASIYFAGNYCDMDRVNAVVVYLRAQIETAGLEPAGEVRWIWLTAPKDTPDPEKHYSELHWPVKELPVAGGG